MEGRKNNILVNTIAPNAGTRMTATIWPQEMVEAFKPDYVAPFVAYLGHESCNSTGNVFEVGGGWVAQVRWQRSGGVGFPTSKPLLPEDIRSKWDAITNFDDGRATHPRTTQEALQQFFENFANAQSAESENPVKSEQTGSGKIDVEAAKNTKYKLLEYSYNERDVILYALGIGATRNDLQWIYENHENFSVIPTFGAVPAIILTSSFPFTSIFGDFNFVSLTVQNNYFFFFIKEFVTKS